MKRIFVFGAMMLAAGVSIVPRIATFRSAGAKHNVVDVLWLLRIACDVCMVLLDDGGTASTCGL